MGHNYPCKDCIVLPVCSNVCDNLYRVTYSEIMDNLILYTEIIEGKYCPDCGCDKGFNVIDSTTYTIVCSKCTSIFTSSDIVIAKTYARSTVMRHWQKGGLFSDGDHGVSLMTFSEFIKGIV